MDVQVRTVREQGPLMYFQEKKDACETLLTSDIRNIVRIYLFSSPMPYSLEENKFL